MDKHPLGRRVFIFLGFVALLVTLGLLAERWLSAPGRFLRGREMPAPTKTKVQTQYAFERFRRLQDEIDHGEDHGPLRCSLTLWPDSGGENQPDLRLTLTNASAEPVELWYLTWLYSLVTFLVRDDTGKIVTSFPIGTRSPIAGEPAGDQE